MRRGWNLAFVLVCLGTAVSAAATIQNALTADPSLWSSDLVRYFGIVLNGIGVMAFVVAASGYVGSRARQHA